jgi:hypothetical protein
MAVDVYANNVLGGGAPASLFFADNFNRASGSLGLNWFMGGYGFTPQVQPTSMGHMDIGASTLDFAQCARFTMIAAVVNPNTIWHAQSVPVPNYVTLNGRAQFVQVTYIQSNGAGANEMQSGPSVFARVDEDTCYYLELAQASGTTRILRVNQGTLAVVGNLGVAPVNGNVYRMSIVPSAPQNDFTVTINAGAPQNFTDNSGSRLSVGTPGFFCRGAGGTIPGVAEYRGFFSGPGA